MKYKFLFLVPLVGLISGCETLQTPQQRQSVAARQRAAAQMNEERFRRLQGRVESVEMENDRLVMELDQLKRQISQMNGTIRAQDAKRVKESQELIRRVEGLLKKSVASAPSSRSRGPGREHVVEAGHTLSVIAQAYGTTVSAIKKANNLKSDNIYVGQKLFIPE